MSAERPRDGYVVVKLDEGKSCGHQHPTLKSATHCRRRVHLADCEKGSEPTLRFVRAAA
jgi:hypothetical protein